MEADPSGYDDGSNLYQMEGDDPATLTDPQGLWKVSRNGAVKADAVSESGDTIAKLAAEVGLEPSEFQEWLTTPTGGVKYASPVTIGPTVSGRPLDDADRKVCPGQKFQIPNEIFSHWGGALGGLGKVFVAYDADRNVFEKRGFKVLAANANTAAQFEGTLKTETAAKNLQGLFIWGHGLEDPKTKVFVGYLTDNDHNDANHDSLFTNWSMSYKLGIGILFTCGSVTERSYFSANAIFWGKQGTLVPGPFHSFAPWVNNLVPPGAQDSKK